MYRFRARVTTAFGHEMFFAVKARDFLTALGDLEFLAKVCGYTLVGDVELIK